MDGHSPTTRAMFFLAILTNGKVTKDGVGPHVDLLAEFPYLGRRTTSLYRAMQLRLSQPSFSRRPGAWALHEGGRYEPTRESAVHAKAHTTGGRAGMSRSSDGRLEVRLSRPGSPGTGTNPEQLFAAGWSACFESAMELAARNMKITLRPITRRRRDRSRSRRRRLQPGGSPLRDVPGMERATAQRLVEAAHQVCPYSRATHGNIAVETTLV